MQNIKEEHALKYAKMGWKVFPCHSIRDGACTCGTNPCDSPGKHPLTKNGFLDATTDEGVIRGWWSRWPSANIGGATGAVSGVVAFDLDTKHGKSVKEMLQTLKDKNFHVPPTVSSQTGKYGENRGAHFFLRHPGVSVKSMSAISGLGDGFDSRGDGGYVILPPSDHFTGVSYEWAIEPEGKEKIENLEDMPGWLLKLTTEEKEKKWKSGLDGVPEGSRNYTAASLTGKLLRSFPPETWESYCWWSIQEWNKKCTPPEDEQKLRATFESIVKKETQRRFKESNGNTERSYEPVEEVLLSLEEELAKIPAGIPKEKLNATLVALLKMIAERLSPADAESFVRLNIKEYFGLTVPQTGSFVKKVKELISQNKKKKENAEKVEIHNLHIEINKEYPGLFYNEEGEDFVNYEPSDGIFSSFSKDQLTAIILEKVRQAEWEHKIGAGTSSFVTSQLNYLKSYEDRLITRQSKEGDRLFFQNGIIEFDGKGCWVFKGFDPKYFSLSKSTTIYDREASAPVYFEQKLLEMLEGDEQQAELFWTIFGACLTSATDQETAFVFKGTGRNGKTTILQVMLHIIGGGRSSFLDFKDFKGNFGKEVLQGKLVNIIDEVEDNFLESTLFKRLTGNSMIKADRKYKSAIEFMNQAKMIIATNTTLRTSDKSYAFYQRLLQLPFLYACPREKRDPHMKKKMLAESSGILNRALDGYTKLMTQHGGQFPSYPKNEMLLADTFSQNSAQVTFLEENFSPTKDEEEMEKIIAHCPNFAIENGIPVAHIKAAFKEHTKDTQGRGGYKDIAVVWEDLYKMKPEWVGIENKKATKGAYRNKHCWFGIYPKLGSDYLYLLCEGRQAKVEIGSGGKQVYESFNAPRDVDNPEKNKLN